MTGGLRLTPRADDRLTYPRLVHTLKLRTVRHTFNEGPGAALAFLWAAGTAALLLPLGLPLAVPPWTILAAALAWQLVRDALRDDALRALLLHELVEIRFPLAALADPDLRFRAETAHRLFVEIALKVIQGAGGLAGHPSAPRLVTDASAMLAMQYESARQAQEFARVLHLVGDFGSVRRARDHVEKASGGLLLANAAALQTENRSARDLTEEIVAQLQTLLLQISQLELRPTDIVHAADFGLQTRESLECMQTEVVARREVANQVIADLYASREPERR